MLCGYLDETRTSPLWSGSEMACIGNKLQITTGHTHKQTSRRRTETHTPHNLPYTDTPQLSHSILKILVSRMKKDQRLQHECPVGMRFMYWQCEKQGQEGLRGRETCAAWRTRNEVREVLWQLQKMAGQNQMRNIKSVCGWRRDNAACGKMMWKPAQA